MRAAPILTRQDLLRRLPLHAGLALLCGAATGALLNLLLKIPLSPPWNLALLLPIGGIYVNGATLPVALPGRHWTFAFVAAISMYFLLIVGVILAAKLPFPHSHAGPVTLNVVNVITAGGIVTGLCVGMFYGLLMGRTGALMAGALSGAGMGYLVGLLSVQFVTAQDTLVYDGVANFAWQIAAAFGALHLAAGLGAVIGFGAALKPQASRTKGSSLTPDP